ncbi:MAG: hypothetical protein AAF639_45305 [Chloroflexota bacterium]
MTVYTGHDNGASCPGTEIATGRNAEAVTYCYTLTNVGDVALSHIRIVDTELSHRLSVAQTLLAGDTLTLYHESTIGGNRHHNAHVVAYPTDATGNPLTIGTFPSLEDIARDADGAAVHLPQGAPGVTVIKTATFHMGGQNCPGSEWLTGLQATPMTYCFKIINSGDTYLDQITLSDARLNFELSNQGPLAPGGTIHAFAPTFVSGDLYNSAVVTAIATDAQGMVLQDEPVTAEDWAVVDEIHPALNLTYGLYNGHDQGATCIAAASDTASIDTGAESALISQRVRSTYGAAITHCVILTNTGDTVLNGIAFQPHPYTASRFPFVLVSGPSVLAPEQQAVYTFEGTVHGAQEIAMHVTGHSLGWQGRPLALIPRSIASDTAKIVLEPGHAGLDVHTSAYRGHNNGASCPTSADGDFPRQPDNDHILLAQSNGASNHAVTYCILVTNAGNPYLTDIRFSDENFGPLGNQATVSTANEEPLAPDQTRVYYYEARLNLSRDFSGSSTETEASTHAIELQVTATPTDDKGNVLAGVLAPVMQERITVEVANPAVALDVTAYVGQNAGIFCPGEDIVVGPADAGVTYCVMVTNEGNTFLDKVILLSTIPEFDQEMLNHLHGSLPLPPGETLVYAYHSTIHTTQRYEATVQATPVDTDGQPLAEVMSIDEEPNPNAGANLEQVIGVDIVTVSLPTAFDIYLPMIVR